MIQRHKTKASQEKNLTILFISDLVLEPQEHDAQAQLTFQNWWQTDFRSAGTLPLKELLHMVRFGFSFGFSLEFSVEVGHRASQGI
jgi:hypothetical protein